jgi:hypothetical protein
MIAQENRQTALIIKAIKTLSLQIREENCLVMATLTRLENRLNQIEANIRQK